MCIKVNSPQYQCRSRKVRIVFPLELKSSFFCSPSHCKKRFIIQQLVTSSTHTIDSSKLGFRTPKNNRKFIHFTSFNFEFLYCAWCMIALYTVEMIAHTTFRPKLNSFEKSGMVWAGGRVVGVFNFYWVSFTK